MSKFLAALAALSLSLSVAACAGEVRVACNAEFPPFEFTDDGNNIIGYDIDVIAAVGRASGFAVAMRDQVFDSLLAGLEAGEFDAVISGMTITEERAQRVDFSDSYYNASQVIVVREGTPGIASLADIRGHTVGVQIGTTGAALAEEAMGADNPELLQFAKYNEVFNNLMFGRLEAVVVDFPVAQTYARLVPGLAVSSEPLSEEQYGIAVRKGDRELLDKINAGLKAIRDSGEYDAITEKWFNRDGK